VLISCPFDPHSSHRALTDPKIPTGLMYNAAVAAEMRRYFGRAVQLDSIKTRIDSAYGFSA